MKYRFFHTIIHPLTEVKEKEVFPVGNVKYLANAVDGGLRYERSLSELEFVGDDYRRIVLAEGYEYNSHYKIDRPALWTARHIIRVVDESKELMVGEFKLLRSKINTRVGTVSVNVTINSRQSQILNLWEQEFKLSELMAYKEGETEYRTLLYYFGDTSKGRKHKGYLLSRVINAILNKISPGTGFVSAFFLNHTSPSWVYESYMKDLQKPPDLVLMNIRTIFDWDVTGNPASEIKISLKQILTQLETLYNVFWFVVDNKLRIEHRSMRYKAKQPYFNIGNVSFEETREGKDYMIETDMPLGVTWSHAFKTKDYWEEISVDHVDDLVTKSERAHFQVDWAVDLSIVRYPNSYKEKFDHEQIFLFATELDSIVYKTDHFHVDYRGDLSEHNLLNWDHLLPLYWRHFMFGPYKWGDVGGDLATLMSKIGVKKTRFTLLGSGFNINVSHFSSTGDEHPLSTGFLYYNFHTPRSVNPSYNHLNIINKLEVDLRTGNCEIELASEAFDTSRHFFFYNTISPI